MRDCALISTNFDVSSTLRSLDDGAPSFRCLICIRLAFSASRLVALAAFRDCRSFTFIPCTSTVDLCQAKGWRSIEGQAVRLGNGRLLHVLR